MTNKTAGQSKNIQHYSFSTAIGCRETYAILTTSRDHAAFTDALAELTGLYNDYLTNHTLSTDMLVFSRIYVSDAENQKQEIAASSLFAQLSQAVISVVQQPPLCGGPIALLLYFVNTASGLPLNKNKFAVPAQGLRNAALFSGTHYEMLWAGSYSGYGAFDSELQTTEIFTSYCSLLKSLSMNLINNALRTWIYVRDVDNQYAGLVKGRRELFEQEGLLQSTRFLASTGIGGNGWDNSSLVCMDALAMTGLHALQIVRMEAPDHMSPTMRYGVTFERGLRLRFGDRSHLFISGTASIDKEGNILHKGDPVKQTIRTIENVQALLEPHNAALADLAHLIVYLRDPLFANVVMHQIRQTVPAHVPILFVNGPVCRTGWLVEVDGMAIIKDAAPFKPFL